MVDSERDRERSPKRRRSRSPETREFKHDGGGQSSARMRSPEYHARRDRDSRRDERESNGARGGRRDSGRDERRSGRGEYSEKDREKERDNDRKRYEDTVKKEPGVDGDEPPAKEPEKPNFGNSGLLARETNLVKGVQIKYNEPPEARKPLKNWRLYVFKGTEQIDLLHIYKQSAYLVGRDTIVTDIPVAHPSCSKQHAAIQFRQITEKNEYGETSSSVNWAVPLIEIHATRHKLMIRPFVIDLDSTNGTHVNDKEIPKSRYYELRNSDVIKFGTSSREYVLLHEDAST